MKLKYRRLELELEYPWTIARSQGANRVAVVLVELTDSEGCVGRGEASPISRYQESTQSVEAFLRRVDPDRLSFSDLAGSAAYLHTLADGASAAKCAVNTALIDGAAKRAGQPAHDFLKLGFEEGRHITSFTIGIDGPDVIRRKVKAAEQYPILKMKVGVPGDEAHLRALREIAPDKTVRVDANEGWRTREEALEKIKWLEKDGHVEFVEQPLPATASAEDWIWLKARSPLPIFGDESFHFASDAARAAECFHGVNVKLVKAGGILEALAALQAARQYGLKTMLGCMVETSLLVSAAAHLAGVCDYLDLDGNLLITNDPFVGVRADRGCLSFSGAPERFGWRAAERP